MFPCGALKATLLAVLLAALPAGPAAQADPMYSWVDARGGIHFTADLNEVPPEQRERAREQAARASSRGLNRVDRPNPERPKPPARGQ